MKKYIDSEIVVLDNEKYIVYLKQVPVSGGKETIRAFVRKMGRKKRNKAK